MPSLLSYLFRKDGPSEPLRAAGPRAAAGPRVRRGRSAERQVRIAVYDSLATVPRIVDVRSRDMAALLNELANKTYSFAHEKGGKLPYVAVKEVVENLLHADFQEAVISILPDGNTIRVSDQGPGIIEKERAFLPGFTTASEDMKRLIRGVGSGLPIVRDSMQAIGGSVLIDDNLRRGCVVTLSCPSQGAAPPSAPAMSSGDEHAAGAPSVTTAIASRAPVRGPVRAAATRAERHSPGDDSLPDRGMEALEAEKLDAVISERQRRVFMAVAERGEAGPSSIVRELAISLSTAYRDLVALEQHGLIEACDSGGKRRLTQRGMAYLAHLAR